MKGLNPALLLFSTLHLMYNYDFQIEFAAKISEEVTMQCFSMHANTTACTLYKIPNSFLMTQLIAVVLLHDNYY